MITCFSSRKRIIRSTQLEREGVVAVYSSVRLDLLQAPLEPGDHELRVVAFCSTLKLRLPEHTGLEIDATSCFTSELVVETLSESKEEQVTGTWMSEQFGQATSRIVLIIAGSLNEIHILRVPQTRAPAQFAFDGAAARTTQAAYDGATHKLG